jgi:uncharacterized protein (DUF2141 family)
MKKLLLLVPTLLLFLAFSPKSESQTFSLTVEVSDLRNSTGVVQFSIYNKDGTIPDEKFKNYFKQKKAKILDSKSKVTFYNLPKGTYAVNILHDENRNGKIDKGWILPIEGIGFSNFRSIGFSNRPSFKKASFNLNYNVFKRVKVIYM